MSAGTNNPSAGGGGLLEFLGSVGLSVLSSGQAVKTAEIAADTAQAEAQARAKAESAKYWALAAAGFVLVLLVLRRQSVI